MELNSRIFLYLSLDSSSHNKLKTADFDMMCDTSASRLKLDLLYVTLFPCAALVVTLYGRRHIGKLL
jgi:hypothetical protein